MTEIRVVENALKLNDAMAAENRRRLRQAGTACVDLIGSPGSGKTSLLERTLDALRGQLRIGVITGDIATTRDAERLEARCDRISQVNTGGGCHLNANHVSEGMAEIPLDAIDLLVVENVGNLICPVGFDLGQDAKVAMMSVPEGDDKPAKHPRLVLEATVALLNKIDLAPHVPFDREVFYGDLRSLREDLPVYELSAATGEGVAAWVGWLRKYAAGSAGRTAQDDGVVHESP